MIFAALTRRGEGRGGEGGGGGGGEEGREEGALFAKTGCCSWPKRQLSGELTVR